MKLPDFLTEWPDDMIVLTGHRVGLYHVVSKYKDGMTAEELHEEYPTLSLELIRKVLAFYHENKAEADAYVARYEERLRRQEEERRPLFDLDELRRRAEAKQRAGH